MKLLKRIAAAAVVLTVAFVFILCLTGSVSGKQAVARLASDGNKRIFLLENDGRASSLTVYCGGVRNEEIHLENMSFSDCIPLDNGVILSGTEGGRITVAEKTGRNEEFFFIEGSTYKSGCIAVTEDRRLYYVDPASDSTVHICECLCVEQRTVKLPASVTALFADEQSRRVFAVSDGGVYDADSGAFIPCEVPSHLFGHSGGVFYDRSGGVFSFDAAKGFVLSFTTDYELLCASESDVFAFDNGNIYILGSDGAPEAVYHSGCTAADMAADRTCAALLTESGGILLVRISDFEAIEKEDSKISEPSSAEGPSQSDVPDSAPSQATESGVSRGRQSRPSGTVSALTAVSMPESRQESIASSGLTSSVYRINGDLVYVPGGTTAAQLRRGLDQDSGSVDLTDHNGRAGAGGQLGTGWMIVYGCGSVHREYHVVVRGDVTGEGNVNTHDLRSLSEMMNGDAGPEKWILAAADADNNGRLEVTDLFLIHSGHI